MRAIHFSGLCLAALAIPAAIAVAQGDTPRPGKPAQTKAEAEQRAMALFDRLDANKDGYITRAEADAAKAQMHARMAERMKARRDTRFAEMDANKDGSISRAEFDTAGARHMEMAMRDGPPPTPPVPPKPPVPPRDGAAPPPPPPPPVVAMKHGMMKHRMMGHGMMGGGMMGGGMMGGPLFDRIDTDHDGRVSRAEAKAAAATHFAMRDHDGDGRIGPEERGRRWHRPAEGKMPS